jgi:outer membrane protein
VRLSVVLCLVCLGLPAAPAAAQDPTPNWLFGNADIILQLGGGGMVRPAYEGSDDYVVRPWPFVDLEYLSLPGIGTFGSGQPGFSVRPSFRFVSAREEADHAELTGMGDIDRAFEFGGTASYGTEMVRGLVTLRRGFGGHEGLVGEVGIDVMADPVPGLSLTIGPRLHFADSEYLETYLGVTPGQSAASGLPAFDPSGGIKGIGFDAGAEYALTPQWSIVADATYERLVGDAADSPITGLGSENQFTTALGLTYRFGLDIFD